MGKQLYSNADGTVDYSTGRFRLDVAANGNILMTAFRYNDPAYKYTDTTGNKSTTIVFNQTTALLFVVNDTTIIYPMTTKLPDLVKVEDYYHRATLDDQGNFRQLYRIKSVSSGGNEGWITAWKFIEWPCMVSNICGVFGFCTSPDNETINCECLEGYLPIDPSTPSKGCYPNAAVDFCSSNSVDLDFKIVRLENADFPFLKDSDVEMVESSDASQCLEAVRSDCFSMAAVYFNRGCYKKRMPLLNARRSIPSTTNLVAFLKVPIINNVPKGHKKLNALLALFVLC